MKRQPWLALLLILVVGGLFSPVRDHDFVLLDDDANVYSNTMLVPPSVENTAAFWRGPYKWMYIPVTYTVWALLAHQAQLPQEERVPGAPTLDPAPFHQTNLALHLLSVVMCFGLLRALVADDLAAALGAAVFGLHPLQVEAVAWVSGMKDVLSGCFCMLAMWQYVVLARGDGDGPEGHVHLPGLRWTVGTVALGLALLSKPSAVVVPLLLALIDYLILRRPLIRVAKWTAGWFALAVAAAVLARTVQPATSTSVDVALWQRPFVAGDALAFYLHQLVLPMQLAPDYGHTPARVFESVYGYASLLVPALILVALVSIWRLRSAATASMAVFVAGVLPVLGFVPFEFQTFSTVSDRYLYLSMLGPAIFTAFVLRRQGPGLAHLAAIGVLGALAFQSAQQVMVWRDTETLLSHTLEVNPHSGLAHSNLGEVLMNSGEVEQAVVHFREAAAQNPNSAQTRSNLGSALGQTGHLEESVEHLSEAVRLDPEYARARMNLASAYAGLGRNPEAIEQLLEVTRLEPGFAPAFYTLGLLLQAQNSLEAASNAFASAVRLDGSLVDARVRRGGILARQGRLFEAAESFRAAVSIEPENGEAHGFLGMALVEMGQAVEAYPHLERALALRPDLVHLRPYLEQARRTGRGPR